MRPDIIKQTADDFSISFESAVKMRVRYLYSILDQWDDYISELTNHVPAISFGDAVHELSAINRYCTFLKKGGVKHKDSITDEMIQIARDYPIENLIEFNRGVAVAFCHDDRRPSLSWNKKTNRAHCFPCGKSFDTIQLLIDRDGMTFVEAVKRLN